MLAGGQRQSRQRIVRMREYSTRATESRGRTFGSIRAPASTFSSGFLPLLHCAFLSFVVDIHAHSAFRRQCQLEDASLWHAEDCGLPFGASRHRMPKACRRRKGDVVRRRRDRFYLPADPGSFPPGGPGRGACRGPQARCRRRAYGNARGPCPSVEFRLTAARSSFRSRAVFPISPAFRREKL
jgi:hypothetical protein